MSKNLTAAFMAIMLLAQIGIAQHATVHFNDHGHYEHQHDGFGDSDHQDHKRSATENCEICVITKSLAFGLISDQQTVFTPYIYVHDHVSNHDQIINTFQHASYNPRAPPAILI